MRCFQALVVFLLVGLAATAIQGDPEGDPDPPRMNSDSAVYMDMSFKSPVVGYVSKGQQVDIKCYEGAWVELFEPPGFVLDQRVDCGGPCKDRSTIPPC